MNEIRPPLSVRPLLGLLLALVTLPACSDPPTAPTAIGPSGLSARELSVAMQDESARSALFEALRSSPYSEHKVSLYEWSLSPAAAPFIAAIASVRGTGLEAVAAELSTTHLDLYMPDVRDREEWAGRSVPAVADAREYREGDLAIWSAGTISDRIDPRTTGTSEVLLLIQPTEPKAYRLGIHFERPARGIQGVGESQEGGLLIRVTPSGVRDSIQLADLALASGGAVPSFAKACPDDHPEWCEGGGSGGGGAGGQDDPVWQTIGTTYLTYIATDGICDNNLCGLGDDNEFEFTGTWSYGNVTETNTIRRTGVPASGIVSNLHLWLLNRQTTLQAPIAVTLVETDAVGDDQFGTIQLSESDMNQLVFWGIPTVTPYVAARFTW